MRERETRYVCMYLYVCFRVFGYIFVYKYMRVHVCARVCMYIFMYLVLC